MRTAKRSPSGDSRGDSKVTETTQATKVSESTRRRNVNEKNWGRSGITKSEEPQGKRRVSKIDRGSR